MRLGLTGRVAIVAGLVGVVFIVQFFFSLQSLHSIEHSTRKEQRASQAVVSAISIEKLVLDLETGERGYVDTGQKRFLEPWHSAQASLPRVSSELRSVAPGPEANELDQEWRSYLRRWSIPVVQLAGQSNAAARVRIATGGGKSRVDRIRALVEQFVARWNAQATSAREAIKDADARDKRLAIYGAIFRIAAFVFILAWLLRAVIGPLRRIAAATARVAGGDQGVLVTEGGAGEVGELSRSFNDMSMSLERNRMTLEAQNIDLERLANVLRAVLDSTVDGILLSDKDGNVQLANRPIVTLTRDFGMSFDGPVVDRLLSVADRMKEPEKYRDAMESLRTNPNQPTFDEFEDSLTGRVFQGFTSPVLDDRGGFLGRIWTLREVTQQRELDRLKDDFVATVSHELRTPLTSMMGFLEMIREEEAGLLTDQQKRFLAIVYRSSERLQRLVGDLLFVARLDANGLQLQFTSVDTADVVHDCVESASALARSREIDLRADLDGVPAVWGDRERLSQLVSNLISNAIKFTPPGGSVTARTLVDGTDAVIEIADTGIGIPLGEQDRLFQRFFRSSTATEQAIPGTGLGLVISKAIAEAHGGAIAVRSATGEGTCFTVRLPLEPQEVAV
jgi:signal transduction histidine kinase